MINFSNFTLNNEGVKDLNEVLFTTAFKQSGLINSATLQSGIENGKRLDYVDNIGMVGLAGRGCNPTYTDVAVMGFEKVWALGDWNIAKKFCYDNLKNTIAKYCMETGTKAEDLTKTDFFDKILLPLYNKAFEEFLWRVAWFGDTTAENVTQNGSGVITAGLAVNHFKICDGLFKRLFAICSGNSAQHTTIAANSQTTYALQKSKIKEQGAALAVLDDLLSDADARISEAEDAVILMTKSLYEAFRKDYALKYSSTIPFMEVAEGVKIPTYDGVKIQVCPEWDRGIKAYEDNGTSLNLPHRAVLTTLSNLFVGTADKDHFAEMTVGFNEETRNNYLYTASNLGTLVAEDELIQFAY